MKLGGKKLTELFRNKHWKAYRGDAELSLEELKPLINANSIDVTLNSIVLTPKLKEFKDFVDIHKQDDLIWERFEFESFILQPNQFVLGNVRERFDCDASVTLQEEMKQHNENIFSEPREHYFVQMYEGRSTVGRLGIESHMTAGFGDYRFKGSFTLEILNNLGYPVKLIAGMKIGQIAFEEVYEPLDYGGAYSSQNKKHNYEPVAPVLGEDRF